MDRYEKIKQLLRVDENACRYCLKGYASMTDADVANRINKKRHSIGEEAGVGQVTELEIHRIRIIMDKENKRAADQRAASKKRKL